MNKTIYIFFWIALLVFVATTEYSQAMALDNFLIYSPLMQLLVFTIALWLLLSVRKRGNSPFLPLFIMWMLYIVFRFFFSETGHEQRVSIFRYSWYCTCFISAYLSSKAIAERLSIAKYFIVAIYTISILLTLLQLSLGELVIVKSNLEGVLVTNIVFWVVCLMPSIFLFKNLNVQLIFLLSGSLVTLMTMKRSALIAVVSMFFLFGLFLSMFFLSMFSVFGKQSTAKRSQKRIVVILMILIAIVAALNFSSQLEDLLGTASTRFESIEETDGNNRLPIWTDCIKAIENSSIGELLFGHGFQSTLPVAGHTSAHNDFLTLFLELGFIAVIFYLYFIFKLVRRILQSKRRHDDLFFVYSGIIIVIISVGLVGDLFTCYTYLGLLTALLGVTEGQYLQNTLNSRPERAKMGGLQ